MATARRTRLAASEERVPFSEARIIVQDEFGVRLDGAAVEILDVPPLPGQAENATKGTSGDNGEGIWRSKRFRSGTFRVSVNLGGFGPPSAVVTEGPVVQSVTFRPVFDLPEGESVQTVMMVVQRENPRLRVKVINVGLGGPVPLEGADIELIGVQKGVTAADGTFVSVPSPFGSRGVNVGKQGFLPTSQSGPGYFTQVEFRKLGLRGVGGAKASRDIELVVTLTNLNPLVPPSDVRPIAVWASGSATPHSIPEDARLTNPGAGDRPEGQDGWDVGINFSSFQELVNKLTRDDLPDHVGGGPVRAGQIKRLGIVAHGSPGVVDVDQRLSGSGFGAADPDPAVALTVTTMPRFSIQIENLKPLLANGATVILAACRAADLDDGEELLKALSREWPTVRVVGIRSIAATSTTMPTRKPGTNALFPGLRDTRHARGNVANSVREYDQPAVWNDLNRLPWISETSTHATVAVDGNIVRRGDPAEP